MKNPFRSLAARITALVFIATVVSSLTVSWIAAESLNQFLRQKVDQRLPKVASRIAEELEDWYRLRTREIEVFAESTTLTESTPSLEKRGRFGDRARAETDEYLRYVLGSFPQFERLVIASAEGRFLADVGGSEALPENYLTARHAPDEPTRIEGIEWLGERRIQVASVPIRDARGHAIARLFALVDVALLDAMMKSDELGSSSSIFLVDPAERFITPLPGVRPEARFDSDGVESDLTSSVIYYDNPLGMHVIGTQKPFARFGWSIVIEQPYDEAFAPIVRSMSRVAALNLVIVLFVGLAAYRIAGSIVKPLRALSSGAKRLSRGERAVEIDETTSSTDEVRVLTKTFNEMSRGLGRNAQELEENHRAIESVNHELLAKNEELSNMNLVLEQLSITDGLTKLHNHRYFQEVLAAECRRSTRTGDPLCLILVDIDFFKKWNDRLGHAGGDEILRRMAEVLNQSVRETDLLARYGGEEFALLAINTDLEGASALGEKVRQAVEATPFVKDVPSERETLTISVGVAAFRGVRTSLFTDADSALYAAKDGGRNRVVVAEDSEPISDASDSATSPRESD